ncbi:MAG: hypothetical protein HQK86_13645 [Nitrospinae bacterium]|nr:hypothetical protein [Nitrospinota bacterium]
MPTEIWLDDVTHRVATLDQAVKLSAEIVVTNGHPVQTGMSLYVYGRNDRTPYKPYPDQAGYNDLNLGLGSSMQGKEVRLVACLVNSDSNLAGFEVSITVSIDGAQTGNKRHILRNDEVVCFFNSIYFA